MDNESRPAPVERVFLSTVLLLRGLWAVHFAPQAKELVSPDPAAPQPKRRALGDCELGSLTSPSVHAGASTNEQS